MGTGHERFRHSTDVAFCVAQLTRSRQRILESAVSLLRERGLSGRLVADAAEAARVPPENAKLLFLHDEELILAFYLRISSDLRAPATALPLGGVAERFRALMLAKLELASYRQAFAGLFATMLDPRTNIGVLSQQTELLPRRARAAFAQAVYGADDVSSPPPTSTNALPELSARLR